jgi:hypothetical protein
MTMPLGDPAAAPPAPPAPPAAPAPQPVPGVPGVTVVMPPAPAPTPGEFLTREEALTLVEKARREEHDKLYPQLSQLSVFEQQVAELTADKTAREAADAEALRLAEEEAECVRLEAQTAVERLAEEQAATNRRMDELAAERDRERVLREKEMEFAELSRYRYDRLQAEAEAIAPQFVDFVRGNTREEIDSSIDAVKAKTAEILEQIGGAQLQQRRQQAPGVTGAPPIDQNQQFEQREQEFTADDLRNMTMEEYAAMRGPLLQAAGRQVAERGYGG